MEGERRKDIASGLRFLPLVTPVHRHSERELKAFRKKTGQEN
jgi:hypothetical protein